MPAMYEAEEDNEEESMQSQGETRAPPAADRTGSPAQTCCQVI